MRLRNSTFEELVVMLRNTGRKIVIYGAGMIGTVFAPFFVMENNLYDNLICFFDIDEKKQNSSLKIGDREYQVRKPERMKEISADTVILITNSNFSPIIDMMDSMHELDLNDAYIIPIMQINKTHLASAKVLLEKKQTSLIPKKINYCWFSGNPMPDYLQKCIESWHRYCPDYEIIRWDESNYDISKNTYMKQAYESKKWGFVPDVARLDILYNEGGLYLDTDVELIKNPDDLLFQEAFTGVEKWGSVNLGGFSGAVPHNPVIGAMLKFRENERFILGDGSYNLTTCGYYETIPLMLLGMKPNNSVQKIENMTIFSSDFFHPYDYMSGETTITENTFSIHHFNGGWLDKRNMEERKKTIDIYKRVLDRMQVD